MNKHTEYKLLQYAALASTAMVGDTLSAQVVYTDIEPDVLLYEDVWDSQGWEYFDLNDDGNLDVGLSYDVVFICGYCPYVWQFGVDLLDGVEIATTMAPPLSLWSTFQSTYSSSVGACQIPSHAVARGFALGEAIFAEDTFNNITQIFKTYECGSNGDFGVQIDIDIWESPYSAANKPFLAFSVPGPLGHQYAWLRVYANADDGKVYVTDKAYQSIPNAGLVIDMPTTSIESTIDIAPIIFSNNNTIHIDHAMNYQLRLVNIQGALVFDALINTNSYTQHLDLPTGMYVAEVSDGMKRISKTIVVGGM